MRVGDEQPCWNTVAAFTSIFEIACWTEWELKLSCPGGQAREGTAGAGNYEQSRSSRETERLDAVKTKRQPDSRLPL